MNLIFAVGRVSILNSTSLVQTEGTTSISKYEKAFSLVFKLALFFSTLEFHIIILKIYRHFFSE